MAKKVKSHEFRGKRYAFKRMSPSRIKRVFSGPRGKRTLGFCDPPDKKKKYIMCDSSLKGLEELDVHIHEALHACYWDLNEEAVDVGSTDIAEFLWRLGYRKVED